MLPGADVDPAAGGRRRRIVGIAGIDGRRAGLQLVVVGRGLDEQRIGEHIAGRRLVFRRSIDEEILAVAPEEVVVARYAAAGSPAVVQAAHGNA